MRDTIKSPTMRRIEISSESYNTVFRLNNIVLGFIVYLTNLEQQFDKPIVNRYYYINFIFLKLLGYICNEITKQDLLR